MEAEDAECLNFWQQLQFTANSDKTKPSDVADALRGLLFQAWVLHKSGRISSQCYTSIFEEYSRKYSNIFDGADQSKEASTWRSGLSMGQVEKLSVWKKLMQETQAPNIEDSSTKHRTVEQDNRNNQAQQDRLHKGDAALDNKPSTLRSWSMASRTCGGQDVFASATSHAFPMSSDAPSSNQTLVQDQESYLGRSRKRNHTQAEGGAVQVAEGDNCPPGFITARQQYIMDCKKNRGREGERVHGARPRSITTSSYGTSRKTLGARRGPSSKFVPPTVASSGSDQEDRPWNYPVNNQADNCASTSCTGLPEMEEPLKSLDQKMVDLIKNEIMDHGPSVSWRDIAGLDFAKTVIKEIIVWPMLRPDIFKGLRGPPKGILLFGPPGTGKTLIGKCIASQSKATFFSISASSLTSKWVGEGEKMVRTLFAVARCHLPAVIFIDEIDSLLSQRTDGEHDASRRIKTEFLVQLDGATTNSDERLLVVGATNRPQEIDEAARRRLVKRLYIPLPDVEARRQIVVNLLTQQSSDLGDREIEQVVQRTDGYSGADVNILCREAALGPIRSIGDQDIESIDAEQVRPILFKDFDVALTQVRPSVSSKDLTTYIEWNKLYGSGLG